MAAPEVNIGSTTYRMEQSPWEVNSHSAGQEIARLLWNAKVHSRVHKTRYWAIPCTK
jgi:hypothetical protein